MEYNIVNVHVWQFDFSVIAPGEVRSEAMNMKRASGQCRASITSAMLPCAVIDQAADCF
jgi:hypothetical protein